MIGAEESPPHPLTNKDNKLTVIALRTCGTLGSCNSKVILLGEHLPVLAIAIVEMH